MLTPEELLRLTEGAEEISELLHQDITTRLIEAIMLRLERGDEYLLTAKDKWMIEVLQEAGYLLEDIQKEIAERTNQQQAEIMAAMEDACVRAIAYDDAIYKVAGLSPTPFLQSPHLIRLAQRNYEATMGEWRNFTRTTAEASQRLFINAVDKAYTLTASGAISYTQAVKEAVNEIAEHGVEVVYPSGHKDTIETATARAVRTGIAQSATQICLARMEEMNWDIILVSSHLGARIGDGGENHTNHSWWQGKFYSKSGNDSRFLPFSVCGFGEVQGLDGPNCRHSIGPGDGKNNPFEQYDSEENRKAYELSQRQRTLERRIRNTKRQVMNWKTAVDNAPDDATRQEMELQYQKKAALLQKQNKAYNEFCEENGLKRRSERIQIAKWDRAQAAKARSAAKKEIEKYSKIHYNKNGTIVVTDDWKNRKKANIPRRYKPNAVVETNTTYKNGTVQIDRTIYGSDAVIKDQIHSGPHNRPDKHPFGKNGEHGHTYVWDENGKLIDRAPRELNDYERTAHADILEE